MEGYNIIKPEELNDNTFKLIGSDWMLITSGDKDVFNTMTASWGSMGVLWHKQVCFIFVRPQRYTFEFTEKYPKFSLSFFEKEHKDANEPGDANTVEKEDHLSNEHIFAMTIDSRGRL